MRIVNPSSSRLPWLLFALVLVTVSAARVALVASTGFNGLESAEEQVSAALTSRTRMGIIAGNGARQLIVPIANFVIS